jgi:hypothetical protein
MKKSLIASLFAFASVVAVPAAFAREYVDEKAKLSVTIPDEWKVESKDAILTASTPDEELHLIMLTMTGKGELKAAVEGLDEALSFMKDIKLDGEADKSKVNGLDAVVVKGTGKVEGNEVKWIAVVFDAGDSSLLVLGFGTEESVKKHAKDANAIFESAKKVAVADADEK